MKNLRIGLLCVMADLLSTSPVTAHPVRLLIVGDSWAQEQWRDGSHSRIFNRHDLGDVGVSGRSTIIIGSTTADWLMQQNLQRITTELYSRQHIDTLQITIGGNDFLVVWNMDFTQPQIDSLVADIRWNLELLTNFILSQRDDIEILLSFYDYSNFEDTRSDLIWTSFCASLWARMGQPDPMTLNTGLGQMIRNVMELAEDNDRISHVLHLGQAQNFFGLPGQPPGSIPAPGVLDQPSPAAAMRTRLPFGGLDCFHFNANAYDVLIENPVDGYIAERYQTGLSLQQLAGSATYSGRALPVPVNTDPPLNTLLISHNGSTNPPIDAGRYEILATTPGWRGNLSGTWLIEPASQSI